MDNHTSDTPVTPADSYEESLLATEMRKQAALMGITTEQVMNELPQRIPGETICKNAPQFGRCADTTCMICYADMPYTLPELPDSVRAAMTEGPSDIDLLNRRLTSLEKQLSTMDAENRAAFQYLCQSMQWLVNMLSGVAQLAQNMPGVSGMMARMMKGGKG